MNAIVFYNRHRADPSPLRLPPRADLGSPRGPSHKVMNTIRGRDSRDFGVFLARVGAASLPACCRAAS